jgi:hypothetical protein
LDSKKVGAGFRVKGCNLSYTNEEGKDNALTKHAHINSKDSRANKSFKLQASAYKSYYSAATIPCHVQPHRILEHKFQKVFKHHACHRGSHADHELGMSTLII